MKKLLTIVFLLTSTLVLSQQPDVEWIDAFGKFESGAYHDAIIEFSTLLSENSNNDQKIELYRGIAEYKLHDYSAALSDLQSVDSKNTPEANIWIARTYAAMGNKQNTLLYIERYLQQGTDPYIDKINKDSAFRFLYGSSEWFELWQKDWLTGTSKTLNDAAYYTGRQNFEQAHQIIESEILNNGSNSILNAFNAEVYAKEGNTELALNEINKSLADEPENSAFLKQRADYLMILSKYADVVNDLSKILKNEPEDFTARYERAEAALKAEQLELAESDIQIYLKYISSADALFLGGQICYASGEYLSALKYFNRLMDRKDPDVKYYRARGLTYFQTNTYDMAASDLSMSLDLEPDNAEANLYMGLAEYNRGNKKQACYYLKRAENYGDLKAEEYLRNYCNQ
jgi:tetratricopeptide (TPR) repeat protein